MKIITDKTEKLRRENNQSTRYQIDYDYLNSPDVQSEKQVTDVVRDLDEPQYIYKETKSMQKTLVSNKKRINSPDYGTPKGAPKM